MKKVSEAVLSSGVVDPDTARLLERWGLVGATSVAERSDLLEALQEIERLVGRERAAHRVSVLDLNLGRYDPGTFQACLITDKALWRGRRWTARFPDGTDGGILLVGYSRTVPHLPKVGDVLESATTRNRWRIQVMERLYQGEDVVAARCEVEEVGNGIQ